MDPAQGEHPMRESTEKPPEHPGPTLGPAVRAQRIDLLASLLGLALLVVPAIAVLRAPRQPFRLEQERRNAGAPPVLEGLSLPGVRRFTDGFERWFGDRLGFRSRFLRAHAELYLHVFEESPHHAVLLGRDGWLFQNAPEMVSVARHLDSFFDGDEHELVRWRERVERRRAAARSVGAEYVLSFAPCKATIFPEYLPESHAPLAGKTRVDELFEHLGAHSDIRWVDVRPALLAVKGRDRIYSKTGLHWTDSGAYWGGYRPMLETLRSLGPPFEDLEPVARWAFRQKFPTDPNESLGLRLYLGDYFPAEVHKLRWPQAPGSVTRKASGPGMLRRISTKGAPPISALVLRDSFGTAFLPLFSMHFAETYHFLPLRVPEAQILKCIQDVKPDVVVDFMYETVLYTPDEILFTSLAAERAKAEALEPELAPGQVR